MNKAGSILEKVARLTRLMRLKRHANAVADAVGAMTPAERSQLRSTIESLSRGIHSSGTASGESNSARSDRTLDELIEQSVDRQLNSDSAIVRIRYIARWLLQTVHLAVGDEDANVRVIYRKAVTILRSAQSAQDSSRAGSWFISDDKKAS